MSIRSQFHIIGVQRRMADWIFEKAHTWEDLLAAHDKWMTDYNLQRHMAHEERQDGCHSPAEVLGGDAQTGTRLSSLPEPSEVVYALAWGPARAGLISGGSDGRLR